MNWRQNYRKTLSNFCTKRYSLILIPLSLSLSSRYLFCLFHYIYQLVAVRGTSGYWVPKIVLITNHGYQSGHSILLLPYIYQLRIINYRFTETPPPLFPDVCFVNLRSFFTPPHFTCTFEGMKWYDRYTIAVAWSSVETWTNLLLRNPRKRGRRTDVGGSPLQTYPLRYQSH